MQFKAKYGTKGDNQMIENNTNKPIAVGPLVHYTDIEVVDKAKFPYCPIASSNKKKTNSAKRCNLIQW